MKKIYTALFILAFSSVSSHLFSQETTINEQHLNALYQQRLVQANNGQDYSQLEADIAKAGIYPSALVVKEIETGGTRYSFNIYSPIQGAGNQSAVENRFRGMFPEIAQLEIRDHKVNVLFGEVSETQLDLFFYYLGYKSIQIKN